MEVQRKPPISIIPKDVWERTVKMGRLYDIIGTIHRYKEAYQSPQLEWLAELKCLVLDQAIQSCYEGKEFYKLLVIATSMERLVSEGRVIPLKLCLELGKVARTSRNAAPNDKEVGRKRAQAIRDANEKFVAAMEQAAKDAANAGAGEE